MVVFHIFERMLVDFKCIFIFNIPPIAFVWMFDGFSFDDCWMFGRYSIDAPSPSSYLPFPISHFPWPGPAECAERLNTASPLPGSAVWKHRSRNCRSRNPYLLPRSEVCGHRAFRRARVGPPLRRTFLATKTIDFPCILLYFVAWKWFCDRSALHSATWSRFWCFRCKFWCFRCTS